MSLAQFSWSEHLRNGRRVGFFHGRFQPFHVGHMEIVRTAFSETGAVVIGISNPLMNQPVAIAGMDADATSSLTSARAKSKNPWAFWVRHLMVAEAINCSEIPMSRVIIVPNFRNTGVSELPFQLPKELTTVYVGLKEAHNRFAAQHYLREGWNVREINVRQHVGASSIREKIRGGESWKDFVPPGAREIIEWQLLSCQACIDSEG